MDALRQQLYNCALAQLSAIEKPTDPIVGQVFGPEVKKARIFNCG